MVIPLGSFMLMDAKCFQISIYRLKQLQQIFVSQQQIKRDIASHAILNIIGMAKLSENNNWGSFSYWL